MKSILLACLLGWSCHLAAQHIRPKEIDPDQFIQELFALQDDDVAYEDFYESLFQLYLSPLNLNEADRPALEHLYLLSQEQINQLLAHRAKTGPLLSLYELQAVPGFGEADIRRLLPFVTVGDAGLQRDSKKFFGRLRDAETHFLILRYERMLQTKRGFLPDEQGQRPFAGSADELYARYLLRRPQDFSFGFTLEKDAGEQMRWTREQQGPDYVSFHATRYRVGRWKTITVGDYLLQIGQGLIMAAGFQVGKGAETTATVRRNTRGIMPYTSLLEGGFFRGAAATRVVGRWELTALASHRRQSASIGLATTDSLSEGAEIFSSLRLTGLHRTANELAARNAIGESSIGGHALYQSPDRHFQWGFTGLHTQFDRPFVRRRTDYNQFEFSGDQNSLAGLHFSYNVLNMSFFGEMARSSSGGIGAVGGLLASLSKEVEWGMLLRHYDRDFHSFYGNAFGENSRNINEQGLYNGLKIKPNRQWELALYHDVFRFGWLRFRTDAPSSGSEQLARLTYRPSKKISLYAQYRREDRPRNLSDNGTRIDIVVPTVRQNVLFNIDYKAEEIWSMRSRVQWSDFRQAATTHGVALVYDLNADFGPVALSGRYALFETDNFDNRQFVYEKDVLYAFSIPAYDGMGTRWYGMIKVDIGRNLDLWLRYAVTEWRDRDSSGSGMDLIRGPQRSEIKIQTKYNF